MTSIFRDYSHMAHHLLARLVVGETPCCISVCCLLCIFPFSVCFWELCLQTQDLTEGNKCLGVSKCVLLKVS